MIGPEFRVLGGKKRGVEKEILLYPVWLPNSQNP